MIVFLNGRFIPEEKATVSILDRGFLYGDGLFETVRVANGKPFRWRQHLERLWSGLEFLKIHLSFTPAQLSAAAEGLIQRNEMPEALLRLNVSRGVGLRGYSMRGANRPTVTMTLHEVPSSPRGRRLVTARVRLVTSDPLARFKTCNKLPQILARAEAEAAGADEALLLNQEGWAVEGSSSNLFWIENGSLLTPPLSSGALPGVTRAIVFDFCRELGLECREANASVSQILESEGSFLTLSSLGLVEASHLDNRPLQRSPLTGRLSVAYAELLRTQSIGG